MNLSSFMSPGTIVENLEAVDRKEVLAELSSLLVSGGRVPEGTNLVTILENREELGSTGIGEGVAIPHVRLKNLSSLSIAVGRSRRGIEFGALDGLPVHLFFLMVSPESSAGEHLRVLALISRLVKKLRVRKALLEAGDREEIFRIIAAEDEKE